MATITPVNQAAVDATAHLTTKAESNTQAKPVIPPTEAKPEPELSPQFAELARKEKAIRKVATTLKQQQSAWESDKANHIPKSRLTSDPLAVLAEAGFTPDKLAELLLAANPIQEPQGKQTQADSALLSEIQALKAEIAGMKQGKTEEQSTAYQTALKQIERDATALVNTDSSYPTIKARGAVPDVVELIEKTFKATGELLSTEEAAKAVEDELIEEGLAWSKLESIQKRLKPSEPVTAGATMQYTGKQTRMPAKVIPRAAQPRNLTNQLNSTRELSPRERAILAFKGDLK